MLRPTHRAAPHCAATPPKRGYHDAPSAKVLQRLKNPQFTIASQLGDRALEQMREMPGTIRRGFATEHALRARNLYYMVQSTPKCMAFLSEALTFMQKDAPKKIPYLQLRHNPKEGSVASIIAEFSANGGNDLSPENRSMLLSGTFGLLHNVAKDESPLSYLIENRAATTHETLRKIAVRVFTEACIDSGYTPAKLEKVVKQFITHFDRHTELRFPTLLYINFKPEDADLVGYHAQPFGTPHVKAKLSEVMPQVMQDPGECKEHFCPERGTEQQMRLVATKSVLTPERIGVINVSTAKHLRQIGADAILKDFELPPKLETLIGKTEYSKAEKQEKREHRLLQKDTMAFKNLLNRNL